jgi:hypothetical protein
MDSTTCNASPRGIGHDGEYGKIGFSPCGEYVSHETNKPCDVINGVPVNDGLIDKENCTCMTDLCPCGEFLSHKVSEPCTYKV